MDGLFTILIIIGCVGLILFVLVQNPKGGGLNTEFGSAVQLGGAKRATDILEKGTWGLAIFIALLSLAMAKPGGNATGNEELESNPADFQETTEIPEGGANGNAIGGPGIPGAPAQ
jgi:preprotein translocase subunit SecG